MTIDFFNVTFQLNNFIIVMLTLFLNSLNINILPLVLEVPDLFYRDIASMPNVALDHLFEILVDLDLQLLGH